MARQCFTGPVDWVVVDDGITAFQPSLGQRYVRREPSATPLQSFTTNLLVGLAHVSYDRIVVIEDDDWYRSDYLSLVANALERHSIVGATNAKNYHVPSRLWRVSDNHQHSALCQTAFRAEHVPLLTALLQEATEPFVDYALWTRLGMFKGLCVPREACIGIKGLYDGLSLSHQEPLGQFDRDGNVLKAWIGETDAEYYLSLHPEPRGSTPNSMFPLRSER